MEPECAFDVFADIRFFFAHFIAADDFQSRNAVGIAPFEEFLEDGHLFIIESGYIRARPADVQIQFVFQIMIHRIACDVHAGFHTARRRIETCVKDGTVGLCRAGSQFRFLFNQDCTKIVLRQFVQNAVPVIPPPITTTSACFVMFTTSFSVNTKYHYL